MKKIRIPNEILYFAAICLLALAVAMIVASDIGLSHIGAPAYELSCRIPGLSFGRAEYIVQGILFAVFCYAMGGFRAVYLSAFVNCLIYGFILDFFREVIPMLNPNVVAPGTMSLYWRLFLYTGGNILTGLSIAMFFKSYLYPQMYDLFVNGLSKHYGIKRLKFKICFDLCFLFTGLAMSFAFFGRLNGIGIGTVITSCVMGFIIEFFYKILDEHFEFPPIFEGIAEKFKLD